MALGPGCRGVLHCYSETKKEVFTLAQVVILMGSRSDLDYSEKIAQVVEDFGICCEMRIASAHKTPQKALDILGEYSDQKIVFITVAGRSNALSGFVDANTSAPVIASPPYSDKFAGADIFSSLRMPSGVAPMVVLDPKGAALAAVKILALSDQELKKALASQQESYKDTIEADDKEVRSG